MNALRRLNQALPGLVVGILIYGLVVELIGVWLVADKLRFTSGLAIGIACAVGMAIHLAVVIEEAVRLASEDTRRLSAKSVLRYLVVVVVFFIMMYFNLGNLVSAFIGVLGLKVSAYLQPVFNKNLVNDDELAEVDSDEEVKS